MFVKMIADSISPQGVRLSTLHARYPRMVHSELMTHRVFSRNGRSSRAVPSLTLIKENLYIPHFLKNKSGMQATEELDPQLRMEFEEEWKHLAELTQRQVESWTKRGMHKQWANRPLEWFGYIDVLISSTDWQNFIYLRDDKDAQPEMRDVAHMINHMLKMNNPLSLKPGEWHLPYITREEEINPKIDSLTLKKVSAARCARISYKPFDGNADIDSELRRYDNLITSLPPHASPTEHQATPDKRINSSTPWPERWENPKLHGNFTGWIQHRKLIANESVKEKHHEL